MKTFVLSTLLFSLSAFAQIDDQDLSAPVGAVKKLGTFFKPDRIEAGPSLPGMNLKLVRMVKGVETPVEGIQIKNGKSVFQSNENGMLQVDPCPTSGYNIYAQMQNPHFSVGPDDHVYELQIKPVCGVVQKYIFEEESDAGQIIGIWQVLVRAEKKLNQAVGLSFWKNQIPVIYPGPGDYNSMGTVFITKGNQWDVVGHEFGHAIYAMARIGMSAGGSHKIDECVSETLGFSEGWASFFSAWVSLDLNDPDAKFEYMVPRRSPIQIENVPADVCEGTASEWRVFSFLWDLVDLHDDGEKMNQSFQELWNVTFQKRFGKVIELKKALLSRGWSQEELEIVWKLNFPAAQRPN